MSSFLALFYILIVVVFISIFFIVSFLGKDTVFYNVGAQSMFTAQHLAASIFA